MYAFTFLSCTTCPACCLSTWRWFDFDIQPCSRGISLGEVFLGLFESRRLPLYYKVCSPVSRWNRLIEYRNISFFLFLLLVYNFVLPCTFLGQVNLDIALISSAHVRDCCLIVPCNNAIIYEPSISPLNNVTKIFYRLVTLIMLFSRPNSSATYVGCNTIDSHYWIVLLSYYGNCATVTRLCQ